MDVLSALGGGGGGLCVFGSPSHSKTHMGRH